MVHAKNAGSGCCNCEITCVVLFDDFDRSNSTNLGGNWNEFSGDWDVFATELRANDVGLIYTTGSVTNARRNASVIARDVQPGKIYRLAFAVTEDGSEYAYVELDCGDPTAFIRLGTTGGGVIEEYEFVYDKGEDHTLIVCVSDEGTYGGLADVSYPLWDCQTFNWPRAGVANLGLDAEYDDFNFVRHAIDIDDEEQGCVECPCECDGKCLPREVNLTLESTCPHRDGLTITLTLDIAYYPAFVWTGTVIWPEPLNEFGTREYNFRLFCARSSGVSSACPTPTDFALCAPEMLGGCATDDWPQDMMGLCTDLGIRGRCSDFEQCDPLEIHFGPGDCEGSPPPMPPPKCTETLIVTI